MSTPPREVADCQGLDLLYWAIVRADRENLVGGQLALASQTAEFGGDPAMAAWIRRAIYEIGARAKMHERAMQDASERLEVYEGLPREVRMSADLLQELSRLDVLAEAMEFADPLLVNEAALDAGEVFVEAKFAAADLEADRTLLRFKIQQRLRDEGKATSDKAAEQMAKDDPEYVAHCEALRTLERDRDRSEILYRVLYQRASLLAKGDPIHV